MLKTRYSSIQCYTLCHTPVITTRGSIHHTETHGYARAHKYRLVCVSGVVVHLSIKPMFHLPPVPGVGNAVPPKCSALCSIAPSLFNHVAQDEHIETEIV